MVQGTGVVWLLTLGGLAVRSQLCSPGPEQALEYQCSSDGNSSRTALWKKKKKEHTLHLLLRQDDGAGLCRTHGDHKHKVRCLL